MATNDENITGWVILQRSTLRAPWYADPNCARLAFHLLLTAQFKVTNERGVDLDAGQLITLRPQLVKETGLTEQEVKTAFKKLQTFGFISVVPTNKFSVVTICNWGDCQLKNSSINQQESTNRHIKQQNAKIKQQKTPTNITKSAYCDDEKSTPKQQNAKINQQINQQTDSIPLYYKKEYIKKKESLSVACATDEERERFFEIFFFRNLINPANEVERFINNYEASGWVRKNGCAAVNREALARGWDEEECNRSIPRRFQPDTDVFLKKWRVLYLDAIKKDVVAANTLIHGLRSAAIQTDALFLDVSKELDDLLKAYWSSYFVRFFTKYFNGLKIKKRIVK